MKCLNPNLAEKCSTRATAAFFVILYMLWSLLSGNFDGASGGIGVLLPQRYATSEMD